MRTLPALNARARSAPSARWRWCIAIALVGAASAARANDDFADALDLTGPLPVTAPAQNNTSATAEPDEPAHDFNSVTSHSVWFKWTASADGTVEINTFGSALINPPPGLQFDTVLAVYTGSTLAGLQKIVGNDDTTDPATGRTKQSRIRFLAQSGTTYHIAFDGYNGDVGNVVLNILEHTAARPSNDHWEDAFTFTGTLPQLNDQSATSTTNSNVSATVQAGEPEHVSESAYSSSVWYRWTAPTSGSAAVDTSGSDFDTVVAVYRGSELDGLTLVTFNDDDEGDTTSFAQFFAEFGTTYYFAVDGFAGQEGEVHFRLQWGPAPPPNDNVNNAFILASLDTVSTDGPNGGATTESDERDPLFASKEFHHPGVPAVSSIWYRWTAPADPPQSIEINTLGSNFDTVLAVYTGTTFIIFEKVASNDDAGAITSRVRFSPIAGQTYRIAIDGKEGAQGAAFLNLLPGPDPPANDDFENAAPFSTYATSGTNAAATVQGSEPDHAPGVVNYGTVWFAWTADLNTRFRASTAGSDFDTTLAVYTGSDIGSLSQLDANDNSGGETSQVFFNAAAGSTYYFAVGGKNLAEGNIALSLDIVGSYGEWLAAWPSLTGDDRHQSADKDGDGYPNAIEMLCGLDPEINSRPELGADPNSASAPIYGVAGGICSVEFDIDSSYIGVSHGGGAPVTFDGLVLGENMAEVGSVSATHLGADRYRISIPLSADAFRQLRLRVNDPNTQ